MELGRLVLAAILAFNMSSAYVLNSKAPQMMPGGHSIKDCLLHDLGSSGLLSKTFPSDQIVSVPLLRTSNMVALNNIKCYVLMIIPEAFLPNLGAIQSLRAAKKFVFVHSNSSSEESFLKEIEKGTYNFDIVAVRHKRSVKGVSWKPKYTAFPRIQENSSLLQLMFKQSRLPSVLRVGHVASFTPFNLMMDGSPAGIDIDLWKVIARGLGLQPVFIQTASIGSLPSLARNGSVDVVAFELLFHSNWLPGNSLSPSTYFRNFILGTEYPQTVEKYLTLLEPFSLKVWLALISSIALMCSVLGTMQIYMDKNIDWFELFSIATGILVNEAIPDRLLQLRPARKATNMLIVTWIASTCLLCLAYQSNLLSCLVKSRMTTPIDTFQNVLDKGLDVYISRGNIMESLVQSHPLPIMQKIKATLVKPYNFDKSGFTPQQIWSKVIKGTAVIDIAMERLYGRRHEVRPGRELVLGTFPAGFYYGQNNPFQAKSDEKLQSVLETGIFQKVNDHYAWILSKRERELSRNEAAKDLVILDQSHTLPIWIGFATFIVLAVVAFSVEKCSKKRS